MSERKQARNEEIIAKRKSGMKLQEIADEYGLSKCRISKICKTEKITGVVVYMPDDCPRCGAKKKDQRWTARGFNNERELASEMNPVDGIICPACEQAFRVSRLESELGRIVDWQTEYEFAPRFCPSCGKDLEEVAR